jgi:hypothetical protein
MGMKLRMALLVSLACTVMACSDDDVAIGASDATAEGGGESGALSDGGSTEDGGAADGATAGDAGDAGPIDGSLPMIDAAGVDAATGTNAFTGAGAFTATLGPSSRRTKHNPTDNPAGQACMTCHDGSKGNVAEFLAGGTVYKTAAGTTPAGSVEVRVREANGNGLSAFSDADGNFYVLRGGRGPLVSPARGGVRDAANVHLMVNLINNGDCNSCHKTGGQAPLNVQ